MNDIIYCDHHATVPLCGPAQRAMLDAEARPGNASSAHLPGRDAARIVEGGRASVATLLGADDPSTVVFTSGATEANNLALNGVIDAARRDGRERPHVLASCLEHSSVLAVLRAAAAAGKIDLDTIPVDASGIVNPDDVADRLRDDTVLVSLQSANNELGTLQPVETVGDLCAARGVLFHTDHAQGFGKIPFDLSKCDLATVSAHKVGGPVGVGALYGRDPVLRWLVPQMRGGSQERGLRAGTLNVAGIAGFGAACDEMRRTWTRPHDGQPPERDRLRDLRDYLVWRLARELPGQVRMHGAIDPPRDPQGNDPPRLRLPQNANLGIVGVGPNRLHARLRDVLALSAGSACKALGGERSHVLDAIGAPTDEATVRIGLGACNDRAQVDRIADTIVAAVRELRGKECAA